jgi:hypothetical protein
MAQAITFRAVGAESRSFHTRYRVVVLTSLPSWRAGSVAPSRIISLRFKTSSLLEQIDKKDLTGDT